MIGTSSGREGLKAAYEHHPDLILLDLMLPDMDGFTVLENLKSDQNLCDIPVVIMSAKELTDSDNERLESQNSHNLDEIFTESQ